MNLAQEIVNLCEVRLNSDRVPAEDVLHEVLAAAAVVCYSVISHHNCSREGIAEGKQLMVQHFKDMLDEAPTTSPTQH